MSEQDSSETTESDNIIEIAKHGDLVIQIDHEVNGQLQQARLRIGSTHVKKAKYFQQILQPDRFGEGVRIAELHGKLKQQYGSIEDVPSSSLPVLAIQDLGSTSVKSIVPLLTDFFNILHGKETNATMPTSNLANLVVVADRFDAFEVVKAHVKKKGFIAAIARKTTEKQEAALTEERIRQRLFIGLKLEEDAWLERYSARLILRSSLKLNPEAGDAMWWELPERIEDEIAFRRKCVLEMLQGLQNHFLALYNSKARQCRLGYDSSPQCDSFQFGEIVRFFSRMGTLDIRGLIAGSPGTADYEGDISLLLDRLKQSAEYQIDQNHSHCGIRTRINPILEYISAMLPYLGICGQCWREKRMAYAWIDAKRPLNWKRHDYTFSSLPQHENRHYRVQRLCMAADHEWE